MKKKYSIFNHYSYMYRNLWEYDYKLVLLDIVEVIAKVLRPLVATALPAFIVGILEAGNDEKSLVLSCLVAFMGVGLLNGLATWLNTRNGARYPFIRLEYFEAMILEKSMDMDYVIYETEQVQNSVSKAQMSLGGNMTGVVGFYRQNKTLFTSAFGLVIYSLIISKVQPLVVLVLLVLSVIQYICYDWAKKYEEKHRGEQAVRNRYQQYLINQVSEVKHGKDIRLFQLQDWLTNLFQKYNHDYRKQLSKNQGHYFLYDFVGLLLTMLRDGICYGYLIHLLTQGMNVSEFVLYLGVITGFGNWFSQISDAVVRLSRCMKDIEHYRSFMDIENIDKHDSGKVLNVKENESFDIVFEDVSFKYPGSEKWVLEHISFHIRAGEKIALVGVNGAGKTTLVKMLCGFYRPTSGRILINGVDIRELNVEKYLDQVSVLFQDSVLLCYTIAENITGQSDEEIDRKKLWEVLHRSKLAEKVMSLAKKERTYIGKDIEDDGVQLSGGQIQKLFLARALYKNANMLILDEPTAALDAIAESQMYDQYAELVKNSTSVFISHRLSSTRFCDRIFFLEEGEIKESGSHDELLKKNGYYAKMFQIQSQYYMKEGTE